MNGVDLTVAILPSDWTESLPLSLAHLEAQTFPAGRFEIVVIDTGVSPQVGELVERHAAGAPVRTRCVALPGANRSAARNRAAREGQGRWVLFLDEDLLASPRLVESHVHAQEERRGEAAILGRVMLHPQLDPLTFTRRLPMFPFREPPAQRLLLPVYWGAHNLSLPRELFLNSGGFDETPELSGAENLELACRLQELGLEGFYALESSAYAWRPTSPAEECRRYYRFGAALYAFERKTGNAEALLPYQLGREGIRLKFDSIRYSFVLSRLRAGSTRAFQRVAPHIYHHYLRRGYHDARSGQESSL